MANKDLVVKMTINSQDFDSGLKNAKASMNDLNISVAPTAIPRAPKALVMPPITDLNDALQVFASPWKRFIEALAFFRPLSKSLLLMVILTTKSLLAIITVLF